MKRDQVAVFSSNFFMHVFRIHFFYLKKIGEIFEFENFGPGNGGKWNSISKEVKLWNEK